MRRYRWAILLTSLLLVGAAAVVSALWAPHTPFVPESTQYVDEEFGFAVDHPAGWTTDRSEEGTGDGRVVNISLGSGMEGITIIVVGAQLEQLIRRPISVEEETTVTVNGIQAQRLLGRAGAEEVALLLFHSSGTLVVLNGRPDLVDTVGQSFRTL